MIALLGATGYLGLSLARLYAACDPRPLTLFARSPKRLTDEAWPRTVALNSLDEFKPERFDLIINALGVGDPSRVALMGAEIQSVTRRWDDLILGSLRRDAHYVFISSGAIYGAMTGPADADSHLTVQVNEARPLSPYVTSKLIAELTHRVLTDHSILDLRVFGFADRSINPDGSFFLSQLKRSLIRSEPFTTSRSDMVRDYAGVTELKALIDAWAAAGGPNGPLDLYTTAPVSKLDILENVKARYGLEVVFTEDDQVSPRAYYASRFQAAGKLGYHPKRTAMKVLLDMFDDLGTFDSVPRSHPC